MTKAGNMNAEKLLDVVTVLQEVSEAFSGMPEEQKECVTASLYITAVNLYLVELAKHPQDGLDPYDAVLKVAKGDTPLADMGLTDQQLVVFRLLTAKGVKE